MRSQYTSKLYLCVLLLRNVPNGMIIYEVSIRIKTMISLCTVFIALQIAAVGAPL